MLFKIGDVLEYPNGYSAVILDIDNGYEFITIEISNGEKFTLDRSSLVMGIASGRIKFKSFSDNVKPTLFIKKHKIN